MKWVFNSYPICADFELWVFQFEGSTEHTVWLEFTSGHLAMTHHSNFVTLLSEQALPGQMGGCHTSVQDLMTGGIPGQMGGHHTSVQGLMTGGEAHMQQFQGLQCAELCQTHVQESGCFLETLLSEPEALLARAHLICEILPNVPQPRLQLQSGCSSRMKIWTRVKSLHISLFKFMWETQDVFRVFDNQKERKRQKDCYISKFLSCCSSA